MLLRFAKIDVTGLSVHHRNWIPLIYSYCMRPSPRLQVDNVENQLSHFRSFPFILEARFRVYTSDGGYISEINHLLTSRSPNFSSCLCRPSAVSYEHLIYPEEGNPKILSASRE